MISMNETKYRRMRVNIISRNMFESVGAVALLVLDGDSGCSSTSPASLIDLCCNRRTTDRIHTSTIIQLLRSGKQIIRNLSISMGFVAAKLSILVLNDDGTLARAMPSRFIAFLTVSMKTGGIIISVFLAIDSRTLKI
jgi:hypothetical protein